MDLIISLWTDFITKKKVIEYNKEIARWRIAKV